MLIEGMLSIRVSHQGIGWLLKSLHSVLKGIWSLMTLDNALNNSELISNLGTATFVFYLQVPNSNEVGLHPFREQRPHFVFLVGYIHRRLQSYLS